MRTESESRKPMRETPAATAEHEEAREGLSILLGLIAPDRPSREGGLHRLLTGREGTLCSPLFSKQMYIHISRLSQKTIDVSQSNTELGQLVREQQDYTAHGHNYESFAR